MLFDKNTLDIVFTNIITFFDLKFGDIYISIVSSKALRVLFDTKATYMMMYEYDLIIGYCIVEGFPCTWPDAMQLQSILDMW